MANMIASFFSRDNDAKDIFNKLQIAQTEEYKQYLNKYPVIHISFNDTAGECVSYKQYIRRIEKKLIRDLKKAYPDTELEEEEYVVDVLTDLYAEDDTARFIFVLDEWDYIFHQDFASEADKKMYLAFLRTLLKDRPYVILAYMTGILPIAKYSSGSELNMFAEYTMASEERFSEYFGFTEAEVDMLFERYMKENVMEKQVTREGLRRWYDGYHTQAGERLYNPRSVVMALANNNLGNYWTSSGPYDEIYYYIENNVAEVRDELALMAAGEAIPVKIREYAATSRQLKTKEEIFSAMVVYGFLSYEKGKVSIPNRELEEAIQQIKDRKYVLKFQEKIGETPKYTGKILAVGIGYDKTEKKHRCKVEVL